MKCTLRSTMSRWGLASRLFASPLDLRIQTSSLQSREMLIRQERMFFFSLFCGPILRKIFTDNPPNGHVHVVEALNVSTEKPKEALTSAGASASGARTTRLRAPTTNAGVVRRRMRVIRQCKEDFWATLCMPTRIVAFLFQTASSLFSVIKGDAAEWSV